MTPAERKRLQAPTMLELKQKIRAAMGWDDRRTWTGAEHKAVREQFQIRTDHRSGYFVAERKSV